MSTKSSKKPKIGALKNKLWKLVSEYVRRKDADPHTGYVSCYTCGAVKHWRDGDAGHAIPGRTNSVLFDLSILRFQCKYCNGPRGGRYYTFGKKLNEENGQGWFEQKEIEANKVVKFSHADYNEMIEDMKKKLEELNG